MKLSTCVPLIRLQHMLMQFAIKIKSSSIHQSIAGDNCLSCFVNKYMFFFCFFVAAARCRSCQSTRCSHWENVHIHRRSEHGQFCTKLIFTSVTFATQNTISTQFFRVLFYFYTNIHIVQSIFPVNCENDCIRTTRTQIRRSINESYCEFSMKIENIPIYFHSDICEPFDFIKTWNFISKQ